MPSFHPISSQPVSSLAGAGGPLSATCAIVIDDYAAGSGFAFSGGMGLTKFSEAALFNHSLGQTEYFRPANNWLCFFSADPTDSGSFANEVGQRQLVTWNAPMDRGILQTNFLHINTNGWGYDGPINFVGVADDPTLGAGNLLARGPLDTPITITEGDYFELQPSSIGIQIDQVNSNSITLEGAHFWLDHQFRGASGSGTYWPFPTTVLVGLHINSTPATLANEMSGGGYQRITVGVPLIFVQGDKLIATNASQVSFDGLPANILTAWSIIISDQVIYTREPPARFVPAGGQVTFAANELQAIID